MNKSVKCIICKVTYNTYDNKHIPSYSVAKEYYKGAAGRSKKSAELTSNFCVCFETVFWAEI